MLKQAKFGLTGIIVLFIVLLAIPTTVSNTDSNIEVSPYERKSPSTKRAENLSCTVHLSNTILRSGGSAQLNVTVTKGLLPMYNVAVVFSCTAGTFDHYNGTTNISGQISLNYTAPTLNITTEITLFIVANRTEPDEVRSNITVKVLSEIDFLSPWVVSTAPGNNSANVSIETNLTIEFSESMNESSLIKALSVSPHFEYELKWQGDNLTIKPLSFLSYDLSYRFDLSSLCTDLYGNSLREFSAAFTTEKLVIPLRKLNVTIDHSQYSYSGEYQTITLNVNNGSNPMANVSITVIVLEGNISSMGGFSDSDGNFSFIHTSPIVTTPIIDYIFINITIVDFEDFRTMLMINVTPRTEHLISQKLALEDGTVVEGYGMANGTVILMLEEGINPTPLSAGFMDIFVNVSSHGQGELTWLNLSVRYLFIPKDLDKQDIAIYYLYSLAGPWLKCMRTGSFPSKNIVWTNISLLNADYPLTVAPRAKSSATQVKASITGMVTDQAGRGLSDVSVGLYRTGVNIRTVKTSDNGSYFIDDLETGAYEIRVDETGYEPVSLLDRIVIAGANSFDVSLEKKHTPASGEIKAENEGYGVYMVFLILFLVLIIVIIIKMYFIRGMKRDRPIDRKDLKEFYYKPGSIGTDIPKKHKTRKTWPIEYPERGKQEKGEYECPVCGSGVSQNTNSCPVCKATFVDGEFVCPDCGIPLSAEDSNCRICGTIFGEGTSREWKSANDKDRIASAGVIEDFIVEKEWDR